MKGLLFDLDGVILDSMPMHTVAWTEYLRRHGFPSDGIADRMHGKRNDEIVAAFWGDGISPEENFRHGAAKEALFREMMEPVFEQHLVPGVAEFLAAYSEYPIGLATNAEPANAEFTLVKANLKGYFKAIVDGMQVQRPKPWPDVYRRAATLLGVEPRNCIVFEDSPTGVEAALAAGARVIGVATHTDALAGVEFVVRDFRDAALHEWLRHEYPLASSSC
jgi:HAD superfamily hydrolase (TIGR01509 family)